jgi:hypothetical protein
MLNTTSQNTANPAGMPMTKHAPCGIDVNRISSPAATAMTATFAIVIT